MPDWLVDTSNVPGVFDWVIGFLGVIAFVFAGCQLRKSRTALEAAQTSYAETRRDFVKSRTIHEIALLSQHTSSLAQLAHQTDRRDAQYRLASIGEAGARIMGLLELSDQPTTPAADLKLVMNDLGNAGHALATASDPTANNAHVIGDIILAADSIAHELNTWSTTLQHTKPNPEPAKGMP